MNTIGLFGGTFDPIHNGHLHIAHAFAQELNLDTVIFLPAGQPYHKTHPRTDGAHRLAMIETAIAHEPRFAVSNIDLVRQGATYTIDTVHIFKQHFPRAILWWLMGIDSLFQLHTWKHWQTLVREIHIAVAPRDVNALKNTPPPLRAWLSEALSSGSLKILSTAPYPASSTDIRHALATGQKATQWLPEEVVRYIDAHGLYRKP